MDSKNPLVFIAGPFNGAVMAMLFGLGYRGTNDVMMADVVVFTGGSDIDPHLYGHKQISECRQIDPKRDQQEVAVFEAAKAFEIPMVGICRGAQLLNALNGGTLYQHVDGHYGGHIVVDIRTGTRLRVTSTHHQMMQPAKDAEVVAVACKPSDKGDKTYSSLSTIKLGDGIRAKPKAGDWDPEVVWYEGTKSLCFQPHPEYTGGDGTTTRGYFVELLAEFIEPNFEGDDVEVKDTTAA